MTLRKTDNSTSNLLGVLYFISATLAHLFKKHKKISALSGAGAGGSFIAFAAKLAFANAN